MSSTGARLPVSGQRFEYRVNPGNSIETVDDEWLRFARENAAASLAEESVTGQPLLDFISDPETRHFYEILMHKVRSTQRNLSLPFRCDAPDRRRFMELTMVPEPDGHITFVTRILREELRESVPLFAPTSTNRSTEMLRVCSWCKRVFVRGHWIEAEAAVVELGLFDAPQLPQITHAMCTDCLRDMEQALPSTEVSPGRQS